MRIALIGYGKMGHELERVALARGHNVAAIIDQHNLNELSNLHTQQIDVAIEFTHPDAVLKNIELLANQRIPIVVGTTGWLVHHDTVEAIAIQKNTPIIWASNYSIGVNVIFKVNEMVAKVMNAHAQYDVLLEERHHSFKADSPSGTALTLAKQIVDNIDRKKTIAVSADLANRPPEADEVSIGSTRSGNIIGAHTIVWSSPDDVIEIQHQALTRSGFAQGAIFAAENIKVYSAGLHAFSALF